MATNDELIRAAYADIGRTGIGTSLNTIDQWGYDYWANQLNSGAINPADFSSTFQGVVNDYTTANPDAAYSQYVNNYQSGNIAPASSTDINNWYRNVIGRDAEQTGADYWLNETQTRPVEDVYNSFLSNATLHTGGDLANANLNYTQASNPYTGTTGGTESGHVVDDMFRNMLGRDPTSAELAYWIPRQNQADSIDAYHQLFQDFEGQYGNPNDLSYSQAWRLSDLPSTQQPPPSTGDSAGFNNPTIPQSPFGNVAHSIPTFNTGLDSPFSGANWRNTITSGTGYSGQSAYDFIKGKAGGDSTLSSLQSDLGLNPGEIMAIYEEAVKYAQANGLATPLMPAVTSANKPYYRYGFNPAQNLYNRNVGGQDVTNPIAAYLSQIQTQRAAETPPVALAKGGSAKRGGLCAIKNDPVIHKYLNRGGQTDNVPAMLSEGEYVIDADVVAALGDGNNGEGARKLDRMRENVRKHKRGASVKSIPPRAKEPEQYLKGK